jgi:hypothetical protein
MMNKAVFLDKDGTVIVDVPYNVDPTLMTLAPGVPEGLKRLQDAGYQLIIISNQSGSPRTVTFETDEIGAGSGGIRPSTPEIAARSTGQLKVDPPDGIYRLSASEGDITPARLEVGERRPSAQDELLQP